MGKFGLEELIVNENAVNLLKFKESTRMENVIESKPLMVNNRPLFVQKWDPKFGV